MNGAYVAHSLIYVAMSFERNEILKKKEFDVTVFFDAQ
tara:strand:- start:62 stop:175 length:114 start_codon:yes stop_codon:yes gene_type:complete